MLLPINDKEECSFDDNNKLFIHQKLNTMKKHIARALPSMFIVSLLSISVIVSAQSKKDSSFMQECDEAKADFIKTDALMKNLFENASGYVIFPNVGKGGIGVGGAAGNGIV